MLLAEFLKENAMFILCCTIGTGLDIGLLNLLVHKVKMDDKIANIISYSVGVIIAFFLCRSFVFIEASDKVGKRLLIDILGHFLGLILQQWLLNFLLKKGKSLNVAKVITIIENGIVMYFYTKYVVFLTGSI